MYARSCGLVVSNIMRQIALCTQQDESVSSYYTRFQGLYNKLDINQMFETWQSKGCLDKAKFEKLHFFVTGLNETYNHLRGQILKKKNLPSIDQAFAWVLQEEQQREITNPHESVSLTASKIHTLSYHRKAKAL